MTRLAVFDTPARVRDVRSARKRERWSELVAGRIGAIAAAFPQIYDPTREDTPDTASVVAIPPWPASPGRLRRETGDPVERWRIADGDRNQQDEYCEWAVERENRKITRVTFTTEVPEYYDFLAAVAPDRLLDVYHRWVSRRARIEDLVVNGSYRRVNPWNDQDPAKGRIAHLTQGANTLTDALGLAGLATVPRERNGVLVTTKEDLAGCANLGDPTRFSDPAIAAVVNAAARNGASLTLADPVGLYIDGLITIGMKTPDGTDPAKFWTIERGRKSHAVRASIAVPETPKRDYVVGDITIRGRKIDFGAQLADLVRVRLAAVVRPGNAKPRPQPCR